jgi:hypothetical protein
MAGKFILWIDRCGLSFSRGIFAFSCRGTASHKPSNLRISFAPGYESFGKYQDQYQQDCLSIRKGIERVAASEIEDCGSLSYNYVIYLT